MRLAGERRLIASSLHPAVYASRSEAEAEAIQSCSCTVHTVHVTRAGPNPVANNGLFIWLIIRFIQLVFLAGTLFFSHKKSVNNVFQPAYNSSRTAPIYAAMPKRQERAWRHVRLFPGPSLFCSLCLHCMHAPDDGGRRLACEANAT
jgi:hypothetical protein